MWYNWTWVSSKRSPQIQIYVIEVSVVTSYGLWQHAIYRWLMLQLCCVIGPVSLIRCLGFGCRINYKIYYQTLVRYLPFIYSGWYSYESGKSKLSIVTEVMMLFKLTSVPFRHYMICACYTLFLILMLMQNFQLFNPVVLLL